MPVIDISPGDKWVTNDQGIIIGVDSGASTGVQYFAVGGINPLTGDAEITVDGIPVETLSNSLLSGEDQSNDWMKAADGAVDYQFLIPQYTTGTLVLLPLTNKLLGIIGAIGDTLKAVIATVTAASPVDAGVYLTDGIPTNVTSGTAGGTFAGVVAGNALALTATSNFTVAANELAGCILTLTYTPTNGTAVVMKRKIASHLAVSGATAFAPKLTTDTPAGATLTGWTVEPAASSYELLPPNAARGVYVIPLGVQSLLGGWRLSLGTEVRAIATGKFL